MKLSIHDNNQLALMLERMSDSKALDYSIERCKAMKIADTLSPYDRGLLEMFFRTRAPSVARDLFRAMTREIAKFDQVSIREDEIFIRRQGIKCLLALADQNVNPQEIARHITVLERGMFGDDVESSQYQLASYINYFVL